MSAFESNQDKLLEANMIIARFYNGINNSLKLGEHFICEHGLKELLKDAKNHLVNCNYQSPIVENEIKE